MTVNAARCFDWQFQVLALFFIAAAALSHSADLPVSTSFPASTNVWERIVLMGASATAGFTESEPLGGPNTSHYRLNRYVEAALLGHHEPVRNLSSTFFFLKPEQEAKRQIELVLEAKPSLVIGIDFLFWFCYGDGETDRDRLVRFENGLKLCERVTGPLVVGDIPDASAALNRMLTADEIPTPSALAAANRRLNQWARARSNVVVLPLSAFMKAVSSNKPLTVRGHTVRAGETSALLQADHLHPSERGCAVLAVMALDAAQRILPSSSSGLVRWEPTEILRSGLDTTEPAVNRPANHDSSVPRGK